MVAEVVVSIGKMGVAHTDYYAGRASGQQGYYTDAGEEPGGGAPLER